MTCFNIGIAALAVLGAAACTSPGQPAQQTAMSNQCIDGSRIREHEVFSNQEIRFTLVGGEVWSNRLDRTCPGLKAHGNFNWDVSHPICAGLQTIYLLDSGIPCKLGEFTRVQAADVPS